MLMPASPLALDQVVAFNLLPIGQSKTIGGFALYQHCPLMGITHMLHEIRVAKPTLGRDHRRRQCHAASVQSRQALLHIAATLSGFGVLFGVSGAWGHGLLLCPMRISAA
jgi:hypothetical protein